MRKPTKEELDTLPSVLLTSDANWDPTKYDNDVSATEPSDKWWDAQEFSEEVEEFDNRISMTGRYVVDATEWTYFDSFEELPQDNKESIDEVIDKCNRSLHSLHINNKETKTDPSKWEKLHGYFGY